MLIKPSTLLQSQSHLVCWSLLQTKTKFSEQAHARTHGLVVISAPQSEEEASILMFSGQVFMSFIREGYVLFNRVLSEANSHIYSARMAVLALIGLQVTAEVRARGPCGRSDAASCSSTWGATSEDVPHRIYNKGKSVLIQRQINKVCCFFFILLKCTDTFSINWNKFGPDGM